LYGIAENFLQLSAGGSDVLLDGGEADAELLSDLAVGFTVGKQQEGGFLLGGEHGEGGFKIELGKHLGLGLVSQVLPDLKLGGAERFGPLLDLLEVEVAKALAQRRIPSRDPDRRRL